MAKKTKTKTKPKKMAEKDRPTSEPQLKQKASLIGVAALNKLLSRDAAMKVEVDSIVGTMREQIANAVEKQHLHKRAFATLKSINRMSAEKAADYWDTLCAYVDMSCVGEKIKSVGHLPLGDRKDGAEIDENSGGDGEANGEGDGNVSRPKFGSEGHARELADTAAKH